MSTAGPVRLLCYHAAELFLKAYLREHGEDIHTLRGYNHDLSAMAVSAVEHGLQPEPRLLAQVKMIAEQNDYVRVRYMVVDDGQISKETVLKLVEAVRECVRLGLSYDELGNPVSEAEPTTR